MVLVYMYSVLFKFVKLEHCVGLSVQDNCIRSSYQLSHTVHIFLPCRIVGFDPGYNNNLFTKEFTF